MSGKRTDGIRTIEDLKGRCIVNDDTDCWLWAYYSKGNCARVWLAELQRVVLLGYAVYFLEYGHKPPAGVKMVPKCGHANCGNPAHRRPGNMGQHMKAVLPKSRPNYITRGRKKLSIYSPELAAEIRRSDLSATAWAKKLGCGKSLAAGIKRGTAWTDAAKGASVFSYARSLAA